MLDNSQGRLVTTKSLEKLLAAIGGKFRTDESAFEAFKTTNTAAIATAKSEAIADAKTYADNLKKAILGEGVTEAFDALKEVEDWINAHNTGNNSPSVVSSIQALETKVGTDVDKVAAAQAKADAALPKAEFEAFKIELEGMFVTEAEVKQMMVDAGLINELPAVPSMP